MDNEALIEQARNVPIEEVIARHGIKLRRSGQERIGPCPKCGGTDRFSINNTKGVFNCRGCQRGGDVIALVEFLDGVDFPHAIETLTGNGLNGGRPQPQPQPQPKPKPGPGVRIVATYDYEDKNGAAIFQVVKYDPKDFRQRRPDGHGGWIWDLQGVRLVPYHLPELIEAIGFERTIFIVEGEKDVDNVIALGAPATCNPRGAGKWSNCNIDEHFRGANVVIIADNDPQTRNKRTGELLIHQDGRPRFAGWDHAYEVAQHLEHVAESVRLVDLKYVWPQCPEKGDVSDWINSGGTMQALYDIAEQTPLFDPTQILPPSLALASLLAVVEASSFEGITPTAQAWAVLHRIPMNNVTLLGGDGATGKTTIALQLCVAVAARQTDWLRGIVEITGPVLFFTAEEDQNEIIRRLHAIVTKRQILFSDLRDLYIHTAPGQNCTLAAPDRAGQLQPTELYQRLKLTIETLRPTLIVLESSADLFGGNENDRVQVRQFITLLRALAMICGSALVLLSHPSLSGLGSGSGMSGSTGWNNSVRSRLYFTSEDEDEEKEKDDNKRLLKVMKSNYGPPGEIIKCEWQDGVFVVESELHNPLGQAALDRKAQDIFLACLDDQTNKHISVNNRPKSRSSYAPKIFAELELALPLAERKVTREALLTKAMNELLKVPDDPQKQSVLTLVRYGSPSDDTWKLVRRGHKVQLL
jgi:RecA-family ATPase